MLTTTANRLRLRQLLSSTGSPPVSHAGNMRSEEGQLRELCDGYLAKTVTEAQLVRMLMRFLPHDEEGVAAPELPTSSGSTPEWSPRNPSDEDRQALPELLSLLASEHDNWEELKPTLKTNDIELFASRLQEAGHQCGYMPLSSWAECLGTYASTFDMAAIPAALE